ncbi:hypothetical protein Ddye_010305 [Dipteronia dyeriana]|uniref:C2H2-type domain-containing protein n=1 Tax=Dipteronia dyeriana TaxID=168575 RepID=A0AAE0CNP5_9ROSI|nr:hypothetical protein Ddye_010305 [Dipteronia dyeriana]
MPLDLDNSSTASGEASISSSGNQNPPPKSTAKKKRNLPGMPDPDAEVIALSPKTLMATNRFVCEICQKGFQRDQNLQLHRRGHNLPWKLRQRTNKEVKKRVYVCPESACVHHHPSRALGDLTGIKKHFCRKHGEKKWKCDKCAKKYAVQSDWKAHSKVCGSREYKCDCGALFARYLISSFYILRLVIQSILFVGFVMVCVLVLLIRRDSFITHRAFCDVLTEATVKGQGQPEVNPTSESDPKVQAVDSSSTQPQPQQQLPPPPPPPPSAAAVLAPVSAPPALTQSASVLSPSILPSSELPETSTQFVEETQATPLAAAAATATAGLNGSCSSSSSLSSSGSTSSCVFASLFASSTASRRSLQPSHTAVFTEVITTTTRADRTIDLASSSTTDPISLCLSTNHGSSLFGTGGQERRQYAQPTQPSLSATALLQKAAQMGATASNASLLRGLGLGIVSSSSSAQQDNMHWCHGQLDSETAAFLPGLGLGLPSGGGSGLKELMMGPPPGFVPKQTTLDFLGLGMASGGTPLSALIPSIGNGLDMSTSPFGGGEISGNDLGSSS